MICAVKWVAGAAAMAFAFVASAQVAPGDNFNQLIKPQTEIATLGPDLFGDKVSLYTGTTEFANTDVSIRGNDDLQVAVGRRFVAEERIKTQLNGGAFGDWDLDIPHLHGTFAAASGWQVSTATPDARCSVPDSFADANGNIWATPPLVPGVNQGQGGSDGLFASAEYWNGNSLYLPGEGDKTMMVIDPGNRNRPTDGASYHWVTQDNWMFSCLPATANGVPGEGFMAVSPKGIRYTFNWVVARPIAQIIKTVSVCTIPQPTCNAVLNRNEVWILPTQIEDRFGNKVSYTYDPSNPWHLTSISASDGRNISLSYNATGQVSTVAAGGQTWNYGYGTNHSLTSVTLPDNSSWQLDFSNAEYFVSTTSLHSDCGDPPTYSGGPGVALLTHPSGATGKFTLSAHQHGRSYVPRNCVFGIGGASYAAESDTINVVSIDSKVISGAGFANPLTWTYQYGPKNNSFSQDCSAASCPTTKAVTVVNPDGTSEVHTFSNKYNAAEGKLLKIETYDGPNLVRSETTNYLLDPTGQPYPAMLGRSPCNRCDLDGSQPMPSTSHVTTQDGIAYTTATGAFDAFARSLNVTKSNTLGFSKVETTEYADHLGLWVLGQIARRTTNGVEVSRIEYDANTAEPTSHYAFGKLKSQYSYFGDGTLNKVTNGRSYTTTLASWKRGIPQSVTYPDNYSQNLTVDDLGHITSVTDQAGNTTNYAYNGVGRVTRIDYPVNDEAAWFPTLYAYDYVTVAERGIAANHWRRTISKGDTRGVTYYDAWMQPILEDKYSNSDASSHSSVRTDFDWHGQKMFSSYPVDGMPDMSAITNGSHSSYDALERIIEVDQDSEKGLLKTTTRYPQAQLATQVTDPKGNVVTTQFQAFENPSYDEPTQIATPEGIVQTITRDAFNSVTSITQAGAYGTESDSVVKYFYYDGYRRLCRFVEPESGSKVMAYDDADNLSWSADGQAISGNDCGTDQVTDAAKTTYTYDSMNRLLTVLPPSNTQSTVNTYDPLGNLSSSISGVSTWQGIRNKLNQLTSETMGVTGNGVNVVRYAHDSYGSLQSVTYPDGTQVDYAPDALGRATKVGSYASSITYHPDGSVHHFTFGNGSDYLAEQNTRQLLSNITYAKGSQLNFSEDFDYDLNGNINSVTDLDGGLRSKSFVYDGLNRLTQAQAASLWGTENYSYDALNNIRTRTLGGQTITYGYDSANRLASVQASGGPADSVGYDTRGNVTSRKGMLLAYDEKNQLVSVSGKDGYAYDGFGHRVVKQPTSGGAPTYYFYTQNGQLLYQFDAANSKATSYVYLGKKLIARSENFQSLIRGGISGVSVDSGGNATINGWSCYFGSTQAVNVTVYEGSATGAQIGGGAANLPSTADVATQCGVASGAFGFSIPITQAVRAQYAGQSIYIFGSNTAGSDRLLIWGSGASKIPALPSAPAAPGTVTATVASDLSNVSTSWASSPGATSYTLQQQLNGGAWSTVNTTSTLAFVVNQPADGAYVFQVQACNVGGCSAWTASNKVTVAHLPPTPASISVPANGNGPLNISWPVTAYATSYALEQSANGGGWIGIYNGAATSYAFSVGVTGSYQYRVKACNVNGCSGYVTSGSVSITIPPAGAPSLAGLGTIYGSSYNVSWTSIGGATSYVLQEQINGGAWTTVQSSVATSWTATGKSHNTTYSYRVQGCNAGGCGSWSAISSAYIWLIPGIGAAPVVTATSGRIGNYGASWSAVPNATYYQVEVTLPDGVLPIVTQSTTGVGGLVHYTGIIKVRYNACNASGCSGWSGYGSASVFVSAS